MLRKIVFLTKTGFPLDSLSELGEWCEVMRHYNVELDFPEIDFICKNIEDVILVLTSSIMS